MSLTKLLLSSPRNLYFRTQAYAMLNPLQLEMLKENCILVNTKDEIIGSASKKDCHTVSDGNLPLHRAFSVFLFNTKKELLLHKRSDTKVTFPGHYTNSCCSHPLFDYENEKIEDNALGVKLAAIRRLGFELSIPKEELSLTDINFITRIIYKSVGDGTWGEHEIDYILTIVKDVTIKPNPEEISEIKFVARHELEDFIKNTKDPITPWFEIVSKSKLPLWWDNLDTIDTLKDHRTIHSFIN